MTQDKFLIVKKRAWQEILPSSFLFSYKSKITSPWEQTTCCENNLMHFWHRTRIICDINHPKGFYEESTNQAYDKIVIYQVYKYIFILPKIIYWYIMLVSLLKKKRSVFLKYVLFRGSIQVSSSPVVHNRLSLVY